MARKMKDSGIEWIGEIPEGWEVVPVKRLCTMQAGKNLTSEQIAPEGAYPVYGGNGIRGFFSDYNCDGQFLTVGRQGALCGNVHKINGKVWATEHAVITTPSSYAILDFLYYLLIGMDLNQYVSSTAAQPGLAVGTLLNLKTCYPCSTLEQTQISNYLNVKCSEINTMLSKTRSSIEEYKKLKQAVITQAITKGVRGGREMKDSGIEWIGEIPKEWSVSPMKHFIDILPGYAFSSDDFCIEEGIPLLRGINVGVNEIRWDETVRWNHSISKQLESFFLKENDLVVGLDRPWISDGTRVAFIAKKDLPCLLLQRVCRIRTRCNFDIRWIYYWLSGSSFKDSLSTETTGISVPHISTKQIEQFIIAFPTQLEQTQICSYLDTTCAEIDKLIAKKEQLVKELESYKKSLIYEVVTGKREV